MKAIAKIFTAVTAFALLAIFSVSCSKEKITTTNQLNSEMQVKPMLPTNLEATQAFLLNLKAQKKQAVELRGGGNTIRVPQDYSTIQQAVDAASPGDKVLVVGGNYDELVQIVTDNVSVSASEGAHIHGGFQVGADGVEIKGFSIDSDYQNQGILIGSSSHVSVKNNYIVGGDYLDFYGIFMSNSTGCSIKNNHFEAGYYGGMMSYLSSGNEIKNNVATNSVAGYGLILWGSSNEVLKENICNNNPSVGIYLLVAANNNSLIENEALGNGFCDIYAENTTSNTILINNNAGCVNVN